VQSVQSITLSTSWTSGTINLVAYRPIAMAMANDAGGAIDCLTGCLPRIINGSVPFIVAQPVEATNAHYVCGLYTETRG
jgi:hypothetical protein